MSTVKKDIVATKDALSRYDNLLERFLPWTGVKRSLVDLDQLPKNISSEIVLQIGKVKSSMMKGIDEYFDVFQNIAEWANSTASQLTMYIELFRDHDAKKFERQKQLLIEMLDNAVAQMSAAQAKLDKSATSFNAAGGILTTLRHRFGPKFFEKKEEFKKNNKSPIFGMGFVNSAHFLYLLDQMGAVMKKCDKFYKKCKEATGTIGYAKEILQIEIQNIMYLRKKTEQTVRFVNLDAMSDHRDMVIQSAQHLSSKCEELQTKYANSN